MEPEPEAGPGGPLLGPGYGAATGLGLGHQLASVLTGNQFSLP